MKKYAFLILVFISFNANSQISNLQEVMLFARLTVGDISYNLKKWKYEKTKEEKNGNVITRNTFYYTKDNLKQIVERVSTYTPQYGFSSESTYFYSNTPDLVNTVKKSLKSEGFVLKNTMYNSPVYRSEVFMLGIINSAKMNPDYKKGYHLIQTILR